MSEVHKSSYFDAYNPKIGYSLALEIVAWCLSLILSGLSFVLIKAN
jgi:hypothetical protein